MRPDSLRLVIIAGEASADMHGAALAAALRARQPDIKIAGIGGERMRQAGVDTWEDLTSCAVIGFVEVLRHLATYRRVFTSILTHLHCWQPAAIVLIDFPGFNLRLAKAIKKKFPHIKIIYYIGPQVWAWGQHRVHLIRRVVDKMIVIFKFEQVFYQQHGIDAAFVGHPLLDEVRATVSSEQVRAKLGFDQNAQLIALLPGSRIGEIKRNLPVMLSAGSVLRREFPELRFAILKAEHLTDELFQTHLRRHPDLSVSLVTQERYNVMSASNFAWVCSGTATLETAILATPLVILYRTSLITWLIAKLLIKLPYIGLVNIVAGKRIVPELIQFQATPRNLARITADFLRESSRERQKKRAQLEAVRAALEPNNAAGRAADTVEKLFITDSTPTHQDSRHHPG